MRVYLVQHGDAVPERLGPERPLSAAGRQEVENVVRLLAGGGARVRLQANHRAPRGAIRPKARGIATAPRDG